MQKLLIIVLLNLAFYLRILRFGYIGDDIESAKRNPENKEFWDKTTFRQKLALRLRFSIFETTPEREHLLSLVLHTFCCSLIYLAFGANNVSFVAALLFSFNPANIQGAVWLGARQYVFNACLVLIAWMFPMIMPVVYIYGLWMVVSILPAPLIFLFTGHWNMVFLIPLGILLLKPFGIFANIKEKKTDCTSIMIKFNFRKIVLAIKTFTYYFYYCLFPYRIGFYHSFLYTFGITKKDSDLTLKFDKWFWLGIVTITGIVTLLITNFSGLQFGLFWFCIFIAMWCQFPIQVGQNIADRYVYLANIGLMLAASTLLFSIPNNDIRLVAITGLFLYYAFRMWFAMRMFKNDESLFHYNLMDINMPEQFAVHNMLGEMYLMQGKPYKAVYAWQEGLRYKPDDSCLHGKLAITLLKLGHLPETLYHCEAFEKNQTLDIEKNTLNKIIPLIRPEVARQLAEKANGKA